MIRIKRDDAKDHGERNPHYIRTKTIEILEHNLDSLSDANANDFLAALAHVHLREPGCTMMVVVAAESDEEFTGVEGARYPCTLYYFSYQEWLSGLPFETVNPFCDTIMEGEALMTDNIPEWIFLQ